MAKQPWIAGFTTNPSLLKKAGVSDYASYARELVAAVPDRHISFEVFSDDVAEMVAQARVITSWGKNVYVKLPVTNTSGEPLFDAVRTLSREGVNINMTAIFTGEQVARAVEALDGGAPACVSVFAGRLADFGIDYRPIMQDAIAWARKTRNIEIIWPTRGLQCRGRMRWAATSLPHRPTCSKGFLCWAPRQPPSFRSRRSNPFARMPWLRACGLRFLPRALPNKHSIALAMVQNLSTCNALN
jgi:hypothetical protein